MATKRVTATSKNSKAATSKNSKAANAEPAPYAGALARAGLSTGPRTYVSAAELSDLGAFNITSAVAEEGTDYDGNPREQIAFTVELLEGMGDSEPLTLTLASTPSRVELANAIRMSEEPFGPLSLTKVILRNGNPMWVFRDVNPATINAGMREREDDELPF